jgi:hypothetical protein
MEDQHFVRSEIYLDLDIAGRDHIRARVAHSASAFTRVALRGWSRGRRESAGSDLCQDDFGEHPEPWRCPVSLIGQAAQDVNVYLYGCIETTRSSPHRQHPRDEGHGAVGHHATQRRQQPNDLDAYGRV